MEAMKYTPSEEQLSHIWILIGWLAFQLKPWKISLGQALCVFWVGGGEPRT